MQFYRRNSRPGRTIRGVRSDQTILLDRNPNRRALSERLRRIITSTPRKIYDLIFLTTIFFFPL